MSIHKYFVWKCDIFRFLIIQLKIFYINDEIVLLHGAIVTRPLKKKPNLH